MRAWTYGSGPAPDWLKDRLRLFQKLDGGVGLEVCGRLRDFVVDKGDTVILKSSGYVAVKRGQTSPVTPYGRDTLPTFGEGKGAAEIDKEGEEDGAEAGADLGTGGAGAVAADD